MKTIFFCINLNQTFFRVVLLFSFLSSLSFKNSIAQSLIVASGTNNYTVTYPANTGASIPSGFMFTFQAVNANTGASTLQVNSAPAYPILKNNTFSLAGNDIKANSFTTVIFDGTNWQMLSVASNPVTSSQWATNGSDIYYSSGNIGIGSSTPPTALAVTGAITVDNGNVNDGTAGTFSTSAFRLGNTNSIGISSKKTATGNQNGMDFWTGSSIRMQIYSGGSISVGGNFAPSALLHQDPLSNSATYHKFTNNNTLQTATDGTSIGIDISGNTEIRNYEFQDINFFTNNVQRMSITSGGVIQILGLSAGILQTDASGNVSVNTGVAFASGAVSRIPYFASATALLSSSQFLFDGSSMAIGGAALNSNYLFQSQQSSNTFPAIYGYNSNTGAGSGVYGRSDGLGGAGVFGNSANVTAGSNGVQGTSSGAANGVNGSNSGTGNGVYGSNNSTGYAGYFQQSGSGYAAAFMGGNVGIGIATPTSSLQVRTPGVTATAEQIAIFDVSDGGGSNVRIGNFSTTNSVMEPSITGNMIGSNNSFVIQGVTNNDAAGGPMVLIDSKFTSAALATKPIFGVSNNAALRMLIAANGNTGIGTTSPQNRLDVGGSVAIGSYAGTVAAPGSSLIVSGNIGIGISNPNNSLEISGPNAVIGFSPSATGGVIRTIAALNQAANTFAGDPLFISAGNGGNSGVGNIGGNLTISGGNANGSGNNNGGDLIAIPGKSTGTGLQGRFVVKDGHLTSNQTGTTSIAATNASGQTLTNATDIAGKISFTSTAVAGTKVTITFSRVYSIAPVVVLTPTNIAAANAMSAQQLFVTSSISNFTVSAGVGAAAGPLTFNYIVIETQ